jgi:hypothetical protein
MTADATLWLVANSASGSNDDDALAALVGQLGAAGHAPARVIDCAAEDPPSRVALEQAGVATLVVFTGDGTVSALLPPLEGWSGGVLVLPGGTTNLLAKMLHSPCETGAIIAALAAGRSRVVRHPCVRMSGHVALCEVLAGPGAKWSDVREGLREGELARVASAALDAVKDSAGGAMVQVAAPELGHDEGYAGVRIVPHVQGLVVDGYRSDGFADYFKQGLALIKRDFREGPHDELGMHQALICRSEDGSPIELMVDGERAIGQAEERFSLATLALDLLATGHG